MRMLIVSVSFQFKYIPLGPPGARVKFTFVWESATGLVRGVRARVYMALAAIMGPAVSETRGSKWWNFLGSKP